MTGFDLPPIRGFDQGALHQPMRELLMPAGGPQEPGLLPGMGREPLAPAGPDRVSTIAAGEPAPRPFAGVLADSLDQVKALQDDVRAKVRGLVLGEDVALHDVLVASSKSEVAFNLLLEVRNKLVDAWEKLSRSSA